MAECDSYISRIRRVRLSHDRTGLPRSAATVVRYRGTVSARTVWDTSEGRNFLRLCIRTIQWCSAAGATNWTL